MAKLVVLSLLVFAIACEEEASAPEIWVDVYPVYVGIRSTNPDLAPMHFDIRFTNRGGSALKIDSILVKGDRNCAFEFDFELDFPATLGENESAFLRGWYKPTVPGDDQVAIEVNSNSHVNAPLLVPVCGKGVVPGTDDPGPESACNVPPPDQADCSGRTVL